MGDAEAMADLELYGLSCGVYPVVVVCQCVDMADIAWVCESYNRDTIRLWLQIRE